MTTNVENYFDVKPIQLNSILIGDNTGYSQKRPPHYGSINVHCFNIVYNMMTIYSSFIYFEQFTSNIKKI